MSILSPPKIISKIAIFLALLLTVALVGCSHQKTSRGHLFRGDWAIEYNRTPWIGCPADSGCPDYTGVSSEPSKIGKLFSCLAKDDDGKNQKGFCRHCGMRPHCTAQNPCGQTPGCGMWVGTSDPPLPASMGGTTKACGLTPFCCPQKPCGLVPGCGKPVGISPQTLTLMNQQALNGMLGITGRNAAGMPSGMPGSAAGGMATVRGMSPNAVMSDGQIGAVPGTGAALGTGALPGTLVSRGIVPGASAITSGGMVAAIGVATPAGTMTPVGVRMPNGVVNNNIVLRACTMTPNCTAAHPCGLTPNSGGAVAVNLVANNAIALASALQAQGVASGVMQAGGMGMLVNPVTNQPINGLTMSGYTQAGYPPIGYATTGYAPGYPHFAAGMVDGVQAAENADGAEEAEEAVVQPETRSAMPVPRFHPIPSKPTFQRNEGMTSTPQPQQQRTIAKPTTVAMVEQQDISEQELEQALDQAYLEGVSAAMNEVERKLEAKRQAAAKVQLQERILQQAEYVQQRLDEQERAQALAMQRAQQERQLRQQTAGQMEVLAAAETVQEPKRLLPPKPLATLPEPPKAVTAAKLNTPQTVNNNANVNPLQLAASLKSSVNGVLTPLLGSNQKEQALVPPKPLLQGSPKPKSELAATSSDLPGKPPVSPVTSNHGLLAEEETGILQAQFTDDSASIRP